MPMRAIKFRAWDGEKMHTTGVVVVYGAGFIEEESFDCKSIHIRSEIVKDLMQFTGLTDKNGIDIYEGDIVLPKYNRLSAVDVVFEKGGFNVARFAVERCEVIGNIYENADLLEKEK
jgi:uncharacterized phage protein (TIGR01671 family)